MGVNVKIDLGGVYKKIDKQAMDRGRYAMANQMLADMNQFVPKKSHTLVGTGHITPKGYEIVWNTKYANAQFYGKFTRTKPLTAKQLRFLHALANENGGKLPKTGYSTPGTGPRWDLKAKGIYMENWKQAYLGGAGIK